MASSFPAKTESKTQRVLLYGAEAERLEPLIGAHGNLERVSDAPDVVVSYGGDGTLLASEVHWPGLPKVPILNSHRGHRCIPHPPEQVIDRLAAGELIANDYMKLACMVERPAGSKPLSPLAALNEINVHMGRINSAVRFKVWLDGVPHEGGREILGDGFLVCTPFGSTAYFSKVTRGIFSEGIGVAFKATDERIDHVVMPESTEVRVEISRGPAILAFDSADSYHELESGDVVVVRKHSESATILTCDPVTRLDAPF